MSSNKNNKRNYDKNNKMINDNMKTESEKKTDDDLEECDKILEQLNQMEQEKQDISSKVKNLIKSDKEAIRKMQEEISRLDDDLDYLDDEKIDGNSEKDVYADENGKTDSDTAAKTDRKADNRKKNNKKRIIRKEKANSPVKENEDLDNNEQDSVNGIHTDNKNAEFKKTEAEYTGNGESESGEDEDEDEVKLDFFANLERKDKEADNRIRKKQPKRLHGSSQNFTGERLKNSILNNRKNFLIGSAIAVLFVILIVALALDSGKGEKKSSVNTEFLPIDTAPMIDSINSYYAALAGDDVDAVRSFLMDSEDVTDEEIKRKSEEMKVYAELISSSFLITDCYVQQGLNSNEYIAYMKFQLQIKTVETPAVGIFTCYLVNVSTEGEADYKIGINVNDKTSEVYKYMAKMRNCSNVIELFDAVDKELEEACEKDENLKAIVEALENTDQSDGEETQQVDDSTTAPMEK